VSLTNSTDLLGSREISTRPGRQHLAFLRVTSSPPPLRNTYERNPKSNLCPAVFLRSPFLPHLDFLGVTNPKRSLQNCAFPPFLHFPVDLTKNLHRTLLGHLSTAGQATQPQLPLLPSPPAFPAVYSSPLFSGH